jgi:hypothetical protein
MKILEGVKTACHNDLRLRADKSQRWTDISAFAEFSLFHI